MSKHFSSVLPSSVGWLGLNRRLPVNAFPQKKKQAISLTARTAWFRSWLASLQCCPATEPCMTDPPQNPFQTFPTTLKPFMNPPGTPPRNHPEPFKTSSSFSAAARKTPKEEEKELNGIPLWHKKSLVYQLKIKNRPMWKPQQLWTWFCWKPLLRTFLATWNLSHCPALGSWICDLYSNLFGAFYWNLCKPILLLKQTFMWNLCMEPCKTGSPKSSETFVGYPRAPTHHGSLRCPWCEACFHAARPGKVPRELITMTGPGTTKRKCCDCTLTSVVFLKSWHVMFFSSNW